MKFFEEKEGQRKRRGAGYIQKTERLREWKREKPCVRRGRVGRVKKLSRCSAVCGCPTNPGFIGCLCPVTLSGLSVCVRGFGREALDMSLIVAELMGLLRERQRGLRKSWTWLRPSSGRLRNPHHGGPQCVAALLRACRYQNTHTHSQWVWGNSNVSVDLHRHYVTRLTHYISKLNKKHYSNEHW